MLPPPTLGTEIDARIAALATRCDRLLARAQEPDRGASVDAHARRLARDCRDRLVAERAATFTEQIDALVAAEEQVQIALALTGKTYGRRRGVAALARAAVRDGYRSTLRSAERVCGRARRDRDGEPALLFTAMATPLVHARATAARHTAPTALSFAILHAPLYPAGAVAALSSLQHAIGHALDQQLRVTETLRPVLASQPASALRATGPRDAWLDEIVADAFATLAVGVGFGRELCKWHEAALPDDGRDQTHPPFLVRAALCWHWLVELGVPATCETMAPLEAARDEFEEREGGAAEQVRQLAHLVMTYPMQELQGAILRDLACGAGALHRRVVACGRDVAATLEGIPERWLPWVAALGVEGGAAPEAMVKRVLAATTSDFGTVPKSGPDRTSVRSRHSKRAREGVKAGRGGRMVPVERISRARTATFIVATGARLPTALEEVYERRAGASRLERLDIFFLERAAVRSLVRNPRRVSDPRRVTLAARTILDEALLTQLAERWTIYEFKQPYFFGCYLDVDRPGGYIHASNHGWTMDLRAAPAVNYEWSRSQPEPPQAFTWYRAALGGLQRTARIVRRSPGWDAPA